MLWNKQKNSIRAAIWVSAVLLLSLAGTCPAAEIKGVIFDDNVIIDQVDLKIQGVAVLKWAMLFNVYAGVFYLPEGQRGRFWTDDVPKRLELAYFREIKASDFADSSDHLLRRNLSPEGYKALEERLQTFYPLFRNVAPGDRYSLTYSPGKGTELSLNKQPLGIVPGADFAVAYFGIWFGEMPINDGFRDQLLGD